MNRILIMVLCLTTSATVATGCRKKAAPEPAAPVAEAKLAAPAAPPAEPAKAAANTVAAPTTAAAPASGAALAPGNVPFVAAPTAPTLPAGAAPVFAADAVQIAALPELEPIRARLAGAKVFTLEALGKTQQAEINATLGTSFASPSPDERSYFVAYLESLSGAAPKFGRETWYVEGQFLGVFQRMPAKDGLYKQLVAAIGREADIQVPVDKGLHSTWVAGDVVYFLRSFKKMDALLIANKAPFARWRQLEEPADNAQKLYDRGAKALSAKPIDQATAQASLQAAVALIPYYTRATARLAKLELLRGNYPEAVKIADEALTSVRDPDTRGDLLYYRAMMDVQLGDIAAALKRLQEATSLGVKAPESTARLNALQGRYDKATLRIALREFRCAEALGMPNRSGQVLKEFPGLTDADAESRLKGMMDFLEFDKFTQGLVATCGTGLPDDLGD